MKKAKKGFVLITCIVILILDSYSQDKNGSKFKNEVFIEKARDYTTKFYEKSFEDL